MLTADELAQIRAELDPAQQAERWRSLALRLLDELEAAESQRGDDGEYGSETEVLSSKLSALWSIHEAIETACLAAGDFKVKPQVLMLVRDVCDAYRAEKERADRLQAELDGMRDVAELHRAKALWGYNPVKDVIVWGSEESVDALKQVQSDRDRLQNENETLRAARESLEPVGWMISMSEYQCNVKPRCWFGPDINRGEKRQVYLAPPQPLEESC